VPRFCIAAGDHDCTVPYPRSVQLAQALIQVGGSTAAQLVIEPGEGHQPDFDTGRLEQFVTALLRATIGPGR